jgi:hypothetical protein
MHIQEKQAWFTVAVFVALLAIALIWGGISGFHWGILHLVALFPLIGLGPLIIFKGKRTAVLMDERDQAIVAKAALGGFWIAGGICYFAAIAAFLLLSGERETLTIPLEMVPFVAVFGLMIWFTARALGIIYFYRRDDSGRTE